MNNHAVMPIKDYIDFCDIIRKKTNTEETIKSGKLVSKIKDVYDAGKRAEYTEFWDNYQSSTFQNQFSGQGWTNSTFKPKHDILPTYAYMLFCESRIYGDLVELLKNASVKLDTSAATSVQYMFWNACFSRIGEIDLTNCQNASYVTTSAFSSSYLETIDKLKVKSTLMYAPNMFLNSSNLTNISFDGVIGKSINFQWCPLSKESILDIFEHLSPTATEQTLTLNLSAVNNAFETSSATADGSSSSEWNELVAAKQNWEILLI